MLRSAGPRPNTPLNVFFTRVKNRNVLLSTMKKKTSGLSPNLIINLCRFSRVLPHKTDLPVCCHWQVSTLNFSVDLTLAVLANFTSRTKSSLFHPTPYSCRKRCIGVHGKVSENARSTRAQHKLAVPVMYYGSQH